MAYLTGLLKQPLNFKTISMNDSDYDCPFCNPGPGAEIITESKLAFAIYDRYPVNKGHALIIPKRHCADYFDLSASEQSACWDMVATVRDILQNNIAPDGFNIGINIGQAAGQTIFHVHIHLIPRYTGDMADPEGGVRGVIPERKKYM